MNTPTIPAIVMIPLEELKQLKESQIKILEKLDTLSNKSNEQSEYITAVEFMEAVRIRRSKFDHLVAMNLIQTIKKGRKIYVPTFEISNYFKNPKIL